MQNFIFLVIQNVMFLLGIAFFMALPFIVRYLGPYILWSTKLTGSRLFGIGLRTLVLFIGIPACIFLIFIPTGAILAIAANNNQFNFAGIDSFAPILVFFILAIFGLQFAFIANDLRSAAKDQGLTVSQYFRRFFSKEYKEEQKRLKEESSQRIKDLYSALDKIESESKPKREMTWSTPRAIDEYRKTYRDSTAQSFYKSLPSKQSILKKSAIFVTALGVTIGVLVSVSLFVGIEKVLTQESHALLDAGSFIVPIAVANIFFGTFWAPISLKKTEMRFFQILSTISWISLVVGFLLSLVSLWIMYICYPALFIGIFG